MAGRRRYYFDQAATSPLADRARAYLLDCLAKGEEGSNSSSLHREGRQAARRFREARRLLARLLGLQEGQRIHFCSGGTEADNWVLQGFYEGQRQKGREACLLASATEHHAVLETLEALQWRGALAKVLPVSSAGLLDLAALEEALERAQQAGQRVLLALHWANNETGAVQDMPRVRQLCQAYGAYLYSDAVAAVGELDLGAEVGAIDGLGASGHKFGAPIGTGFLVVNAELEAELAPLIYGGAQEGGLRAGTQNADLAMAMALALEERLGQLEARQAHIRALREAFLSRMAGLLTSGRCAHVPVAEPQLESHLVLLFPNQIGEELGQKLDQRGFALSSGSACQAGLAQPSHVLLAMGYSYARAQQSLRICFSETQDEEAVLALARAFEALLA